MKRGLRSLLVVFVPLLVCCGKDSGSTSSGAALASVLSVTFTNIKGFAIAPPTTSRESLAVFGLPFLRWDMSGLGRVASQNLYSLNNDGSLSVVAVTAGDQGKTSSMTSSVSPDAIFDTLKFTFFQYTGVTYQGKTCSLVAARKTDSALFCIEQKPFNNCGGAPNYWSMLSSDSTGNLIYLGTGNGFYRIDFTDASNPVQTTLVNYSSDGTVCGWTANSSGDVLANLDTPATRPQVDTLRIYRRSGGFQAIANVEGGCVVNGVGADDVNFYYTKASTTSGGGVIVRKLTQGTTFADTAYYDDGSKTIGIGSCGIGRGSRVSVGSLIKTSDKIFMANDSASAFFIELINGSTPVKRTVADFSTGSVSSIFPYSGGMVILGVNSTSATGLVRYETTGPVFTTLLAPGTYAVTKVSVGTSGEVTFAGQRASDGVRVIGTIPAPPAAVSVTIVTQALSGDITQILRIN